MNVETTLIAMMRNLSEPQPPNEAQWNRFARRAHRSLWGRRAAAVGTVGLTAFVGTSLVDGGFAPAPVSPAATQGDEKDASEVEVWFVKDGQLHKTTQESSAGASRNGHTGMVNMFEQVEDALERLFAGPPSTEEGLTSAIPAGTQLVDFEVTPDEENDGAAIVRITVSDEMAGAVDQQLATAQVVYTATQVEGMESVRLVVGNEEDDHVHRREDYEAKGSERIVVIMESEPGQDHVLYPSTVVRGTADLDGGQLFYKLFGANGDLLSGGQVKLGPCKGPDCRRPFAKRLLFDIDEEQRGRLELYIRAHGEQTHMMSTSITLEPG